METWLGDDGRTLVRAGRGRVTAVVPQDAEAAVVQVSVEIEVAARPGQARAVRLIVRGLTQAGSPAHETAQNSLDAGGDVDWTIRWVPHSWVPADIPIASLRLATDTTAYLTELSPIEWDEVDTTDHSDRALEAELRALIERT